MASSLLSSPFILSSPAASSRSPRRIKAFISLPTVSLTIGRKQEAKLCSVEMTNPSTVALGRFPEAAETNGNGGQRVDDQSKLYAVLEAVAGRVEMHRSVAEQRNDWNTLLLSSINMITLGAVTMAALAATAGPGVPVLPLRLSSALLFTAATGFLAVVNAIQPSQLVEEQRSATKLFKQLQREIETAIVRRRSNVPADHQAAEAMERVLALDKAFPLPLLGGAMLEKFPSSFRPAVWWSRKCFTKINGKNFRLPDNRTISGMKFASRKKEKNGWNEELEMKMREILRVIRKSDIEDYAKLGNRALRVNKILAISGPVLTGVAAVGSAFVGSSSHGSWAAVVVTMAGALATIVNTLEHGGQVGMVFEMYRNCAGFFQLLGEAIESTLQEEEFEKRENGELFEMKVALQLGRSLAQMKDLAEGSRGSRAEGETLAQFASKLF